jgi:hypothetical protein
MPASHRHGAPPPVARPQRGNVSLSAQEALGRAIRTASNCPDRHSRLGMWGTYIRCTSHAPKVCYVRQPRVRI